MRHFRLRTQLITFLILQTAGVLALASFYLQWQMRRQIEEELALRLVTSAQTLAAIIPQAVETESLLSLLPGDEGSRTLRALRQWLLPLEQSARLSRLAVVNASGNVLYDSANELRLGDEYVRLRFDRAEFQRTLEGEATAAKLFHNREGEPFKAAYAPLLQQRNVAAVVCVEASATSLAAVNRTRQILLSLAGLSLLAVAVSGALFARLLTRPLESLTRAAERIGRGRPEVMPDVSGNQEIKILVDSMQQMQTAIVRREQHLRMMLGGVAHEIRNPVGGIRLFAGLLEPEAPLELQAHVQKILTETTRIEEIIRSFLAYARPSATNRERIQLREAIEEVWRKQALTRPEISWHVEIPPACMVNADRQQLHRILINLVENAAEAVANQGTISITAERVDREVWISIKDDGPGIADDIAERIFEPFFTTRARGSGLGLALARSLVEQNDGTIELIRDEGSSGGAHFRLKLPAWQDQQERL